MDINASALFYCKIVLLLIVSLHIYIYIFKYVLIFLMFMNLIINNIIYPISIQLLWSHFFKKIFWCTKSNIKKKKI